MSEFEIASLDYRAATLAIREIGVWIAAAHVAVGVLQAAVVGYGIHAMIRANRDRAAQAEAQARAAERRAEAQARAAERRAEAQARAADQRHAENMRRLDAIIDDRVEQRRASDAQTRALMELLERAAPNAPPA